MCCIASVLSSTFCLKAQKVPLLSFAPAITVLYSTICFLPCTLSRRLVSGGGWPHHVHGKLRRPRCCAHRGSVITLLITHPHHPPSSPNPRSIISPSGPTLQWENPFDGCLCQCTRDMAGWLLDRFGHALSFYLAMLSYLVVAFVLLTVRLHPFGLFRGRGGVAEFKWHKRERSSPRYSALSLVQAFIILPLPFHGSRLSLLQCSSPWSRPSSRSWRSVS